MTTIACTRTEISGDRLFVYSSNIKYAGKTKIYEFDNEFAKQFTPGKIAVGFCGNVAGFPDALDYIREGGKPPRLSGMEMLLLTDTQEIWWGTNFRDWTQIESDYWAIGNGMPFALPILAKGGSSVEAVEAAMEFDVFTGIGTTTISFA